MSTETPTSFDADQTQEHPAPQRVLRRVNRSFGADSHPGSVRTTNEDHFIVARLAKAMRILQTNLPGQGPQKFSSDEAHLIAIADGMGGVAGGAEASRLAIAGVEEFVLNTVQWFLGLGGSDDAELKAEAHAAFEHVDREILREARARPALQGMGTTLTMAYCIGDIVYLAHVGDSRAYLFRRGTLEQVTNDHTLVQLMVQGGFLTAEQAKHHPRRNVVTNVVGGPRPGVYAEFHKIRVEDGDLLLLCSDGLTEALDEPALAATLGEHAEAPESAVSRLMAQALQKGASDNVTVVVCRFGLEFA